MLGEAPTPTTEIAVALTPHNIDTMRSVLAGRLSGVHCTLVIIHPPYPGGVPAGDVLVDRQLTDFHTDHPEAGRAVLYFHIGTETFTLPVGKGNDRTSEAGVDHAATFILTDGIFILSHIDSSGQHTTVITPS